MQNRTRQLRDFVGLELFPLYPRQRILPQPKGGQIIMSTRAVIRCHQVSAPIKILAKNYRGKMVSPIPSLRGILAIVFPIIPFLKVGVTPRVRLPR